MPSALTDPTDPTANLSPDMLAQLRGGLPAFSLGTPNLQLPSGGDYVFGQSTGGHSVDTGENSSSWVQDPAILEYHPPGQGPGENYYTYDETTGKYLGTQKGSGIMPYAEGILGVLGAGVGFGAIGAAAGGAGAAADVGAAAAPAADAVAPAVTTAALPPGAVDLGGGLTMMPDGSVVGGMDLGASTMSNADIMSSIGVDPTAAAGALPAAGGGGGGVPPPANPFVDGAGAGASITGNPTLDSMLGTITKDPLKLAMLGLSLKGSLSKPKLPGAAQTALDNANSSTTTANNTINSGGMGSPAWAVQKSAIDSQYDLMLRQETEAIKQNAANSGMGMAGNSMVVQQQINAAQERNMGARQEAYQRALSENLTAAVAQLSGGNSVLTSIAQMQLSQSRDAQATAAEVAKLAAQLGM